MKPTDITIGIIRHDLVHLERLFEQLKLHNPTSRPEWCQGNSVTPWGPKWTTTNDWWLECPKSLREMLIDFESAPADELKTKIQYSFYQLHRFVMAWIENVETSMLDMRLCLQKQVHYQGDDGIIRNTSVTPEKVKGCEELRKNLNKIYIM